MNTYLTGFSYLLNFESPWGGVMLSDVDITDICKVGHNFTFSICVDNFIFFVNYSVTSLMCAKHVYIRVLRKWLNIKSIYLLLLGSSPSSPVGGAK